MIGLNLELQSDFKVRGSEINFIIQVKSKNPCGFVTETFKAKQIFGSSVTFGLKSVEKCPPGENFFELTTPTIEVEIAKMICNMTALGDK